MKEVKDYFIGKWGLDSWTLHPGESCQGQEISHPYGDAVSGDLEYKGDGCMEVSLKGGDQKLEYSGTFKIEGGMVVHEVLKATAKALVGTSQRRRFLMGHDGLCLFTEDMVSVAGVRAFHRLEWKKSVAE